MDDATWFTSQLRSTAEGFCWAAEQLPAERRTQHPPAPEFLGEWTLPRHVFHLYFYEREVALPSMRQWLGGSLPDDSRYLREDEHFAQLDASDLADLLARFRAVREEQIALLGQLPASAWEEPRACVWGAVTLKWVVSKTFQHTAEHTHDVMKLVLFWDRVLARQRAREAQERAAPRES